ncbi:MAG TPA: acyl-CoA dehydrogenase C-terminal domain-containing protein [Cellvibrionaceae bacterium]
MPHYRAPLRDFEFLMREVFALPEFWQKLQALADIDWDTAFEILNQAGKWCEEVLAPLNREADEQGCSLANGQVSTPKGFKQAYSDYSAGGWVGLGGNPQYGGMGLPKSLVAAVEEMVQGSCMAFGLAPMLTSGACVALDTHASEALKTLYLPKLYSGEWAGVMDLTEPQAGTDLGLLRTQAVLQTDGSYLITGSKIFITWGEQDFTDNIIHLVLARMPDAPAGVKGISLFLVPKFLLDASSNKWTQKNALSCGALEKKMGIKACATCVMNFDGATGWLIGEANQGLACMFTMMNYERLVVGIQGLGAAHGSFIQALEYANTRLQSRSPTGVKNKHGPADPIIEHPDVRRMLLTMRAYNEAGRAFYVYVAMALDGAKYSTDPTEARAFADTVALLTPIAKAFITDKAFDTAVLGQQVFGGHGYIREWGQEQYVRDIRITQIYEGTNGIQAMDLLGRKIVGSQGELLKPWLEEIHQFLNVCKLPQFPALRQAAAHLSEATNWVLEHARVNPALIGQNAVAYLHLAGLVAYGYMWLRMSAAAAGQERDLYQEKQQMAAFYCQHLLPQTQTLHSQIIGTNEPWVAGFSGV